MDHGLTNTPEQDETHFPPLHLLVQPHQTQIFFGSQTRRYNGQSRKNVNSTDTLYLDPVNHIHTGRQLRSQYRTCRNGFSMQPPPIAHCVLDCMAKGVSEVEQGADTAFTLVSLHNFRLIHAASPYCFDQDFGITSKQLCHILLDPIKKNGIPD